MYAQHFGLKQDPFSIAPDPRYLFMSERHREALAHLLYGLGGTDGAAGGSGGGFVLLSGEIGTGKTTVCRCFLEQIPAHCNVAYIFNPRLTVIELLQTICDEFHIPVRAGAATAKDFTDALNAFLLQAHASGRSSVLIIDEAQNLSADVLEQLRLLTNLETPERKLLQIVLIGQPELRHMLARPELEQLAQRVIARFHLQALSAAETTQYIAHRLAVAGHTGALPFDAGALKRIHRITRGVPRRINLLCGRALLGAYAHGRAMANRTVVDKAAREVFDEVRPPAQPALPGAAWPSLLSRAPGSLWNAGAPLRLGIGAAAIVALVAAAFWTVNAEKSPPAASSGNAGNAGLNSMGRGSVNGTGAGLGGGTSAGTPGGSASAGTPAGDTAALFAPLLRDETQAWRALAAQWKLDPGLLAGGAPCESMQRAQIHCFARTMNLALIRQLDRPGLLTLYDADGKPAYALLAGLAADSALLRSPQGTQAVPLATLAQAWRGEFATLWRAPAGYSGRVSERSGGPVVDWLAARLAALSGASPPAGAQTLDAALKARVQALQRAQGLEADGVPGPLTFMQINRASGVDEPRLSTWQR